MQIKILQLNMWAGTHFEAIEKFLSENQFDILCFQEVCGPQTIVGNIHCEFDCFEKLKDILGATHGAQLTKESLFTSSETAYDGNAIFYRKDFILKKSEVVWFHKRNSPFPSDSTSFDDIGRNALSTLLEKNEKQITILSGHLPWASTEIEQSNQEAAIQKLIIYTNSLQTPWIMTGDFNLRSDQPSILGLEKYGVNVGRKYSVTNTVDPLYHRFFLKKISEGTVIDYIFVSPDIQVDDFKVLDNVHMSDHFGLVATVEI